MCPHQLFWSSDAPGLCYILTSYPRGFYWGFYYPRGFYYPWSFYWRCLFIFIYPWGFCCRWSQRCWRRRGLGRAWPRRRQTWPPVGRPCPRHTSSRADDRARSAVTWPTPAQGDMYLTFIFASLVFTCAQFSSNLFSSKALYPIHFVQSY